MPPDNILNTDPTDGGQGTPPTDVGQGTPPADVGQGTPPTDVGQGTPHTPPGTPSADPGTPSVEGGAPPAASADWAAIREKVANGDDKVLNQLSRYSTLEDALKAGLNAQQKIRQGVKGVVPGENATPEELAEYRKDNGIPDTPDGYKLELPEGQALSSEEKQAADSFFELAHKYNIPQKAANDIVLAQLAVQEQMVEAQIAKDQQDYSTTHERLSSPDLWGSETKANINLIHQMFDGAPQGVKENLIGARLADGTMLGNHVDSLRFLATLARQVNPYASVLPNQGMGGADALNAEMARLEGMMGDHNSEYWKGPSAAANQDRYQRLVQAKQTATRK